jgi:hypothetical protein
VLEGVARPGPIPHRTLAASTDCSWWRKHEMSVRQLWRIHITWSAAGTTECSCDSDSITSWKQEQRPRYSGSITCCSVVWRVLGVIHMILLLVGAGSVVRLAGSWWYKYYWPISIVSGRPSRWGWREQGIQSTKQHFCERNWCNGWGWLISVGQAAVASTARAVEQKSSLSEEEPSNHYQLNGR